MRDMLLTYLFLKSLGFEIRPIQRYGNALYIVYDDDTEILKHFRYERTGAGQWVQSD